MFPSKTPLLYILHVGAILVCIVVALLVGLALKEPLALLSLLCLKLIPEFPLMPQGAALDADGNLIIERGSVAPDEEDEDPGYSGSASGFLGTLRR